MSNTDLYYTQLTNLSLRIAVGIKNRREPLGDLTQALDQLSQTNAIKGNAADAMKAYICEVHMPLIQTLQLILFNYQAALGNYVTGYLGVDSAENFQLVKEDLDDHERKLSSHRSDFTSFGNKLKAISDEAEDIIWLGGAGSKSISNVVSEMDAMKRTVSNLKENWDKYDNSYKGFDQVQDLITQTASLLKSTLSVPRGYSYSPGSFNKLINKNFVNAFQVNADYAQNPANQKAVQDNWNKILKNYKVDQDRMAKEAKEKAQKEGRIGLIWDSLQICAGVVLVATGGGAEFGVVLIAGGVNGAINHASMATTGKSFNILGNLTNGGLQWYNKNIGSPLVKTGNPVAKFVAGLGNGAIEVAGAAGQFNVYDTGKSVYTLATNSQARAQFGASVGNWWNQVRSGDAYTIGQTTAAVASVLVSPGDVGAAASKASKAESLLGKAGTFSKSIAVSGIENAKNIIKLPKMALNNLGGKLADLRTIFSQGKGLVGNFTKSVVVSGAKNAKNLVALPGKIVDDLGSKFTDLRTALSQGNGLRYAFADAGDGRSIFSRIGKEDIEHVDADKICHDRYIQWSKGEMPGGTAEAEIKLGKADLDAYRKALGVPERNTVAVGKAYIEGLKPIDLTGASPAVRSEANLAKLDDIAPDRSIKAPTNVALNKNHAEEELFYRFEESIKKSGLNPNDVKGELYIHQSNPKGVCPTCLQGVTNPNVKPGIFKQFSEKYPNLVIKVTSEGSEGIRPFGRQNFTLINGKYR